VTHLRKLLDNSPPAKRKSILQHLTRCLQPVLEKAILHPPIAHRWVLGWQLPALRPVGCCSTRSLWCPVAAVCNFLSHATPL